MKKTPLPPDKGDPTRRLGLVVFQRPSSQVVVAVRANLNEEEQSELVIALYAEGFGVERYHMDHTIYNPSEVGETHYRGFVGSEVTHDHRTGLPPWQEEATQEGGA